MHPYSRLKEAMTEGETAASRLTECFGIGGWSFVLPQAQGRVANPRYDGTLGVVIAVGQLRIRWRDHDMPAQYDGVGVASAGSGELFASFSQAADRALVDASKRAGMGADGSTASHQSEAASPSEPILEALPVIEGLNGDAVWREIMALHETATAGGRKVGLPPRESPVPVLLAARESLTRMTRGIAREGEKETVA